MKKYLLLIFLLANLYCFSQTGNVCIGITTPGFPLSFSSTLGDKISLWENSGSHYGFGIQRGLLQIHSDAPAANISSGYGSSANFMERMRIINSGGDGNHTIEFSQNVNVWPPVNFSIKVSALLMNK
jgi:hypothetical protein